MCHKYIHLLTHSSDPDAAILHQEIEKGNLKKTIIVIYNNNKTTE